MNEAQQQELLNLLRQLAAGVFHFGCGRNMYDQMVCPVCDAETFEDKLTTHEEDCALVKFIELLKE